MPIKQFQCSCDCGPLSSPQERSSSASSGSLASCQLHRIRSGRPRSGRQEKPRLTSQAVRQVVAVHASQGHQTEEWSPCMFHKVSRPRSGRRACLTRSGRLRSGCTCMCMTHKPGRPRSGRREKSCFTSLTSQAAPVAVAERSHASQASQARPPQEWSPREVMLHKPHKPGQSSSGRREKSCFTRLTSGLRLTFADSERCHLQSGEGSYLHLNAALRLLALCINSTI